MKSANDARRGNHPELAELALWASHDLPWPRRFRLKRHLDACAFCSQQAAQFCSAREAFRHDAQSQTLTGYEAIADWQRLEREMVGNIAVGVAAARCIDKVGRKRFRSWRGAFVGAGMAMLLALGWMMNIPREESEHLALSLRRIVGMNRSQPSGTILQSTPDGIAVRAQGATMTLLHPASAVVTVAGNASVGALYVDEDSGEVTITNVYGQ
ncbi:MAG TPA: hypothetical protein VHZ07_28550 [Bryobacteraceae bacterium]|jgi:hypothetical protein|nr:hypothetical protein [Bryobacteraceae bacterium]